MPSSTCRSAASGSARSRPSSSSTPSRRSRGRPGTTLHLRGTGRNDHHLAEAAFKALGVRAARGLRARPATHRRRLDEGRARMTARPRVAVVDYGAGNLVSIDQAFTTVGAEVTIVRDAAGAPRTPTRSSCPGSAPRRRRWPACATAGLVGPIRAWLARRSAVPRHLPRPAAALRAQRRGRRGDARASSAATRSASRTRRRSRTSAGTRSSGPASTRCSPGSPTARTSTSSTRTPGAPAGAGRAGASSRGPSTARRFVSAVARGPLLGVQFHPERSGADGLRLLANFVALARAA